MLSFRTLLRLIIRRFRPKTFRLELASLSLVKQNFKPDTSPDEYNAAFLRLFKTYRPSFRVDHSHNDGHFRV